MTRVSTEVLYITSLSSNTSDICEPAAAAPHIQWLSEYYLQARVRVETCGNLIRRRYFARGPRGNAAGDAETGRRDAEYKLDELRSRLTPPFPHPSAKLVEFSAILPPGNLNLVPRRYLPSLSEIYYGARPHKGRRRRRAAPCPNLKCYYDRGNRKADPNRSARSRLIARTLQCKEFHGSYITYYLLFFRSRYRSSVIPPYLFSTFVNCSPHYRISSVLTGRLRLRFQLRISL